MAHGFVSNARGGAFRRVPVCAIEMPNLCQIIPVPLVAKRSQPDLSTLRNSTIIAQSCQVFANQINKLIKVSRVVGIIRSKHEATQVSRCESVSLHVGLQSAFCSAGLQDLLAVLLASPFSESHLELYQKQRFLFQCPAFISMQVVWKRLLKLELTFTGSLKDHVARALFFESLPKDSQNGR